MAYRADTTFYRDFTTFWRIVRPHYRSIPARRASRSRDGFYFEAQCTVLQWNLIVTPGTDCFIRKYIAVKAISVGQTLRRPAKGDAVAKWKWQRYKTITLIRYSPFYPPFLPRRNADVTIAIAGSFRRLCFPFFFPFLPAERSRLINEGPRHRRTPGARFPSNRSRGEKSASIKW